MLIPQTAQSRPRRRHGRSRTDLAELRRSLADHSAISEAHRQRLQNMARRVARVQALGGEYTGIRLSDYVLAALNNGAGVA